MNLTLPEIGLQMLFSIITNIISHFFTQIFTFLSYMMLNVRAMVYISIKITLYQLKTHKSIQNCDSCIKTHKTFEQINT